MVADAATLGTRDVVQLWRQYSDHPDFRLILEAAFPEIVGQYAQAAALATAQAYDEWAPELPYHAVPVVDLPAERIMKTIAWALYARGSGTPLDRIVGALVRMIFDGSRGTVLANLDLEYADYADDPVLSDLDFEYDGEPGSEPEGTRWARYASANACGFCRVLATRKAVYRSAADALTVTGRSTNLELSDRRMIAAGTATVDERLAVRQFYSRNSKWGKTGEAKVRRPRGSRALGEKYHDHCHCTVVAVRPGQSYNPPAYVQQWQQDYEKAHAEHGSNLAAIANAMDQAETGRRAPAAEPATAGDSGVHSDSKVMRTQKSKRPPEARRPDGRPDARRPEPKGGSSGGGRIPPTRFMPKGMDVPDDYPPLPDGSMVPFTPATAPMPKRGDMTRVLHKHRAGATVPDKTHFPRDWSDRDIENAIELTIRRPSRDVLSKGDKLQFERIVDGVLVRVLIRVDLSPPRFWSAYAAKQID